MHPVLIIYLIGFVIVWIISAAVWQYEFPPENNWEYIQSALWGLFGAMVWPLVVAGYIIAKLANILMRKFTND